MVVTLATIPLNMWLYKFVEDRRRAARIQQCDKFVKNLRTANLEHSRKLNAEKPLMKTSMEETEMTQLVPSDAAPSESFLKSSKKKENVTVLTTNLTVKNE